MSCPSDAARFLRTEALAALGRLRAAWPWLAEARIPGPEGPAVTPPDRREYIARVRAEAAAIDRRAKHEALAGGASPDRGVNPATRGTPTVPPGPHADAARVGPVAARHLVAYDVRSLAERLWEAGHDRPAVWGVADPASRPARTTCPLCAGVGYLQAPLWWPDDKVWPDPRCRPCGGTGTVPNPDRCPACGQPGRCDCDHADAVVTAAFTLLADLLPRITDPDRAADAVRTLDRADRTTRRAARAGEHRTHIQAPCPACQSRDLWAETSSPNREDWTVRCESPLCSCDGPGCPCGRPVRYRGRRHLWPAAEWGPRGGLADRLGVPLTFTDRT